MTSDDIVKRLDEWQHYDDYCPTSEWESCQGDCHDAAREIERLRKQLEEAQLLAREFYQHVGSMVQRTPETHGQYLERYPWLGR